VLEVVQVERGRALVLAPLAADLEQLFDADLEAVRVPLRVEQLQPRVAVFAGQVLDGLALFVVPAQALAQEVRELGRVPVFEQVRHADAVRFFEFFAPVQQSARVAVVAEVERFVADQV